MGACELVELLLGGVKWKVEAPYAALLARELLGAAANLSAVGTASLVKRSLQRTVYRVTLSNGQAVIAKVYHVRGWKERLKRLVFGPKPQVEWRASLRLRALGVPASHAIAVGVPAPRSAKVEGYLVVEVLPDIVTLGAYARSLDVGGGVSGEDAVRQVIRELAGFVRRLHDRGVRHHDLHSGNILARTAAPSPEERFLIIDLHRIGLGRPPECGHRRGAIAQLLGSLAGELGAELRSTAEAFLDAYVAAGAPLPGPRLTVDSVLAAIARRAVRRLASRARRCLVNSTQFAVETTEGWRIYHRRNVSSQDVLALWRQHRESVLPAVTRLADGREMRQYPARGPLARLLARSPAVRDYAAAHRARIETGSGPQAIAAAECRRGPDRGKSFALLVGTGGRLLV